MQQDSVVQWIQGVLATAKTRPRVFLQGVVVLMGSVCCLPAVPLGFVGSKALNTIQDKRQLLKVSSILLILIVLLIEVQCLLQPIGYAEGIHLIRLIQCNWVLLSHLLSGEYSLVLEMLGHSWAWILGLSLGMAIALGWVHHLPDTAHHEALKTIQQGRYKIPKKRCIKKALATLNTQSATGTVLGVSLNTGKSVEVADKVLNQILLVLGTTGSGKTVTLQRFYQRAIDANYPLIIVDGKPDPKNIARIQAWAKAKGKSFYGFNCGNHSHYDFLSSGGYTELKDKIICLKDEWESDYYKTIAETYLQTALAVLQKLGKCMLKDIIEVLDFEMLIERARETNDASLQKKVERLSNYEQDEIKGLQAHLELLANSELGSYLTHLPQGNAFSIKQVINENAVVYFALPALRFPSFAKVLGKLVVNDLKTVIDRLDGTKKVFAIFDEFSVFAGNQVLNLVNMGRGKGLHAIFGTQGLADLEEVSATFKEQVLNCVNSMLIHRINSHQGAEEIAAWIGTKETYEVTAQITTKLSNTGLGSAKQTRSFIVHPDEIKQGLGVGEVFWVNKLASQVDRLSIISG